MWSAFSMKDGGGAKENYARKRDKKDRSMTNIRNRPRRPARTTITVRLTREQLSQLTRACKLHQMSQTGCLTRLAVEQIREDLLRYAVTAYESGKASVSTLAKETGLDVPTILDAVAMRTSSGSKAAEAFLAEARDLSRTLKDPEFYEKAKAALRLTGS